jgi:hypothetical protein
MSNMKKYLEIPMVDASGAKPEPLPSKLMCIDTWMYLQYDASTPETKLYVHLTGGTHRIIIEGEGFDVEQGLIDIFEKAMVEHYTEPWVDVSKPLIIPVKMLAAGTYISAISMSILP